MPRFRFVARDAEGRTRRATEEAPSEAALVDELRGRGLVTLEVAAAPGGGAPGAARDLGLWRLLPPRSVDVETGLQQVAFMLKSGLPLVLALKTCSAQSSRRSMSRIWTQVSERVQAGGSFGEALSGHPCFPELAVTMTAVGEHTGDLPEVLLRSAAAMERRRTLATAAATALTYPAIVVVMAAAVVAYMMVGVIPRISKFLVSFNRQLPPMTRLLIDVSDFVQTHGLQGVVAGLLLAAAIAALRRWPPGRVALDRLLVSLPLVGGVLRLAATATFARNLASLVASGVRLTDALRVVGPLFGNAFLAARVADVRERVLQGATLAEPLADAGAFLPMLPSMVGVGESSGTLDTALAHVAEFHEKQLEATIRRLAALIEPLLLLVVGGIVGFIYISFFMALYAVVGAR